MMLTILLLAGKRITALGEAVAHIKRSGYCKVGVSRLHVPSSRLENVIFTSSRGRDLMHYAAPYRPRVSPEHPLPAKVHKSYTVCLPFMYPIPPSPCACCWRGVNVNLSSYNPHVLSPPLPPYSQKQNGHLAGTPSLPYLSPPSAATAEEPANQIPHRNTTPG
jgi:hypothetical protein